MKARLEKALTEIRELINKVDQHNDFNRGLFAGLNKAAVMVSRASSDNRELEHVKKALRCWKRHECKGVEAHLKAVLELSK